MSNIIPLPGAARKPVVQPAATATSTSAGRRKKSRGGSKVAPFTPTPTTRWFLDFGDDGDCYLVPIERQAEWARWIDLDSDDEASWTPPAFAVSVDGPHAVEFVGPVVDGLPVAGTVSANGGAA